MTRRTKHPIEDRSNGYEAVAAEYMSRRVLRNVGLAAVQRWTWSLPHGGSVVDLGCGNGLPLSMALLDEGLDVHGIDASPSMVAAFRHRFPGTPVICEPAETSNLFGRTFDGALAWGLVFLLDEAAQRQLIRRVAQALTRGGRFLFTSPARRCTWRDALTGRRSRSLGAEVYRALLSEASLAVVGEYTDEGDNDYYDAVRL